MMSRMLPLLLTCGLAVLPLTAIGADDPALGPDPQRLQAAVDQAAGFLRTTQGEDGSWTSPQAPGVTALVARGLLKNGLAVDDPMISAALKHLEGHIQPNGGIYYEKTPHKNYETAVTLMAFEAANEDGRYDTVIDDAVRFLKGLQWDEEEVDGPAHPAYGGAGYGTHQRPDLSNTTFFLEALETAGVPSDDPAVQKALMFVSRCQNLETEHNTTPFAAKVNDGGFYYTPAAGGSSQAGETPDGGLRSYASMTYAGLKSMIYAGLTEDDPRVKAATDWIRRFYSLEENPGMGQHGLFYYYHTFAKALAAMDVDLFEDAAGNRHDWRQELAEHLFEIQRSNGSWVNRAPRWYEGDPNLVTAYTLLALQYCHPPQAAVEHQ